MSEPMREPTIGEQIQELRTRRGWDQRTLADFACTSPATISRIERDTDCSTRILKRVLAVFGRYLTTGRYE